MSKREEFRKETLKKMIFYILGKRPDEFGLLPDREGFVKLKELIQALHEEGLTYVRESHIRGLILTEPSLREELEIQENRIRLKGFDWKLDLENPASEIPKLLYTCIRRRAYPFVLKNGLIAPSDSFLILSESKDMAFRIGKRKDSKPILLEVIAHKAEEDGSVFFKFGELYLSKWINKSWIIGPPFEEEEKKKEKKIEEAFSAGTFPLKEKKGKKKKTWKEEVRKLRRKKLFF